MQRASRFSHDDISKIHSSIITLGIERFALLAGIRRDLVATLPNGSTPSSQILSDLHTLNDTQLSDASDPLLQCLVNASTLAGPRAERAIIDDFLRSRRSDGTATALPRAPFELYDDIGELRPNPLQAARAKHKLPSSAPTREISIAPETAPKTLLPLHELVARSQGAAPRGRSGEPRFPSFSLGMPTSRKESSVFFDSGQSGALAVGIDGSISFSEEVPELTGRAHLDWGNGVGLMYCIDRLVGALIYARNLHANLPNQPRLTVSFRLLNVQGQRLAPDFESQRRMRLSHAFRFKDELVSIGGSIATLESAQPLVLFSMAFAKRLCYFAGWDHPPDAVLEVEVKSIMHDWLLDPDAG